MARPTVYNDEMEAKAIGLSHLSSVPVNSLKGYYGPYFRGGRIDRIDRFHAILAGRDHIAQLGFFGHGGEQAIEYLHGIIVRAFENLFEDRFRLWRVQCGMGIW